MSRKQIAEKSEKSMAELLIVITIFSVLIAIFIAYFLKQESQISTAGFGALTNKFGTKVVAVHGQWLMDKQPREVKVVSLYQDETVNIPVNKKGWIDVKSEVLACEAIWQHVMDIPMLFLKSPVSAVEIHKESMKVGRLCRYSLVSGQYFEYRTDNGQVNK